ncbi:Crp/Fnr family transcriptional regulator [uncultured Mesonia sp.]|uniref:Crp/Fnr family transcriptional regulator n=1 Tax=uncultured Mesonia sp. TaxID=399731 RepID=UPI00374F8670
MIEESSLIDFGAEKRFYAKEEYIFKQDQPALFYFQIASGEVKMNNYQPDGKEFIQAIFSAPRSFGEPPLFADIVYPANAIAIKNSLIWRLPKSAFYELLRQKPDTHLRVSQAIAKRLHYKALMAAELAQQSPENRILKILDYLKQEVNNITTPFGYKTDLTRQNIADLTGLRVETVIRTLKELEQKNEVKIINRKVYR